MLCMTQDAFLFFSSLTLSPCWYPQLIVPSPQDWSPPTAFLWVAPKHFRFSHCVPFARTVQPLATGGPPEGGALSYNPDSLVMIL